MQTLIANIAPASAFGGPIRGDTLFGQLCWAALHRWGESRLCELLECYTSGKPFLVISDAFPEGHLPRPALPLHRYEKVSNADRKQVKKRQWLPVAHFGQPLGSWLQQAVTERDIQMDGLMQESVQSHNTINRMTGTTGSGEFAPYVMPQRRFSAGIRFDLYIVHDERLSQDAIGLLLRDVGYSGYGRDASIGLGKFEVVSIQPSEWPTQEDPDSWYTLAPCAPQGVRWKADRCFYQPFTRFGRHGDIAVHSGQPFKTPLLMADTGALLTPEQFRTCHFVGQGLGGEGSLSKAIPETVHQGYAPVLPVCMEDKE